MCAGKKEGGGAFVGRSREPALSRRTSRARKYLGIIILFQLPCIFMRKAHYNRTIRKFICIAAEEATPAALAADVEAPKFKPAAQSGPRRVPLPSPRDAIVGFPRQVERSSVRARDFSRSLCGIYWHGPGHRIGGLIDAEPPDPFRLEPGRASFRPPLAN
jgi:hypothetical protein